MPKRGPKPLPAAVRMLRGNPGAKPINRQRPIAEGRPVCPKDLSPDVGKIWKRLTASMPPQLYGRVDEPALAVFCTAYAEFLQAVETMEREGRVLTDRYGRQYEHPALRQFGRCADLIAKLGDRLGLSPTARDALKLPETPPTDTLRGMLK